MRLVITGEYPVDWPAIACRVKDEAGWRCVRCRHSFAPAGLATRGGQPLPCDDLCSPDRCAQLRHGKRLNYGVHHLDGDKGNCRWWNLLALCNACHLCIQAKVIPDRPYLWEHSDWFKPYVAGYYAFTAGNREITRAEAEADLDRWLAIGQPWRAA
jgi:hypothetical protein